MTHSFAEAELARCARDLSVVSPLPVSEGASALQLCRRALDAPKGSGGLHSDAAGAKRIAVIVSDASRDEPRDALLGAVLERLPRERVVLVIATGTHATDDTTVIPQAYRDLPVVVHDARDAERHVDLGTTARGTRVRIDRAVAEADLVIATGRVRPHYFAGLSGGVKSVFPGCALAEDALQNHLLKAHPSARLGRVDGNVCRFDMEEAAARLPGQLRILNVLCDVDGGAMDAAFGDATLAHRALAATAARVFTVVAPRSRLIVVADRPPVTHTLYQASKLIPPAAALLEPGGVVVVVADCAGGTGPLQRVNRGIYELGLVPQLPADHSIWLVSQLPDEIARSTYARPFHRLEDALREAASLRSDGPIPALWRAGECIARPVSA